MKIGCLLLQRDNDRAVANPVVIFQEWAILICITVCFEKNSIAWYAGASFDVDVVPTCVNAVVIFSKREIEYDYTSFDVLGGILVSFPCKKYITVLKGRIH